MAANFNINYSTVPTDVGGVLIDVPILTYKDVAHWTETTVADYIKLMTT